MGSVSIQSKGSASRGSKVLALLLIAIVGLALSVGSSAFHPDEAYALSSKNKAAHKAYRKVLWKTCIEQNGNIRYYYKDINGDKVDDMVMWGGSEAMGNQLYTYVSGKARKLGYVSHGKYVKYHKKSKTLSTWSSHDNLIWKTYYKWGGKELTVLAQKTTNHNVVTKSGKPKVYYKVKGKTVSSKKYKTYVKKLTKGKSINANKTMKDYLPVKDKKTAMNLVRAWVQKHKNLSRPIDFLEYEGIDYRGYFWVEGKWSNPTNYATAYRCFVSKAGYVDYRAVGAMGMGTQTASQNGLHAATL